MGVNDAKLIKALGWDPCRGQGHAHWCETHSSLWYSHTTVSCHKMTERLGYVRTGMNMTKEGVAHEMQVAFDEGIYVSSLQQIERVKEWEPW